MVNHDARLDASSRVDVDAGTPRNSDFADEEPTPAGPASKANGPRDTIAVSGIHWVCRVGVISFIGDSCLYSSGFR